MPAITVDELRAKRKALIHDNEEIGYAALASAIDVTENWLDRADELGLTVNHLAADFDAVIRRLQSFRESLIPTTYSVIAVTTSADGDPVETLVAAGLSMEEAERQAAALRQQHVENAIHHGAVLRATAHLDADDCETMARAFLTARGVTSREQQDLIIRFDADMDIEVVADPLPIETPAVETADG